MPKRGAKLYLDDIRQALQQIRKYRRGMSLVKFVDDQKTIDAVLRNFEIIGEAARNIPAEIINKHPDVPWDKMISLRNKVSHEYFGVDLGIIWQTIEEDLSPLEAQLKKITVR